MQIHAFVSARRCGREAAALSLNVAALVCLGLGLTACRGHQDAAPERVASASRRDAGETAWFVDATAETGLAFRHINGMSGQFLDIGRGARWRRARADGSYASANDPRALVGLGASKEAPRARIIWPDGRIEEWSNLPIDRYTTLEEGAGK